MTNTYTVAAHALRPVKELMLASLAADQTSPLSITPVIHPRDDVSHPACRTFWSATANALYIVRQNGADLFGPTPGLSDKLAKGNDRIEYGRRGPIGCDTDALAGIKLWEQADAAATRDRPATPVAYYIIGWLPVNRPRDSWRELVLEFLDREIVINGMVADWAIHALADAEERWLKKPHMHAVLTHRFWNRAAVPASRTRRG